MKIAINTLSIIPGKVGGTEIFLVNLIENLVRTDNKNEFLFIVSRNNKGAFANNPKKVEHIEFNFDNNSRARRVFVEQFIFSKELKKRKIDLLVAPGNTGLLYCPCKTLLIVHDLIYFIYPKYFSLIKRIYLHNLVKYSCKKASRIITMSQNTKNDIIKYTGVSEDKIDVIYEGVDFEKFSRLQKDEASEFIQKQYGIQNYIYSPTSLYPHKNNDLLVKAFAQIKNKKGIGHKLIITGIASHQKKAWLQNLISKEKMENEIFYLGIVPDRHIPYLYSGADLTVYLSSYEGFGLPILEAMAAGCPVLSSNKASLPEVVGDAGVLVNPFSMEEAANNMYKLLTNEKLKKTYIERGLIRAKKFSWERVAKRLINIYEHL